MSSEYPLRKKYTGINTTQPRKPPPYGTNVKLHDGMI
jgi:hypothetical protein